MQLPAQLTLATVTPLLAQADRLAAAERLDLSTVQACDSAGLSFLLELQRRARRAGRSLRYTGNSAAVHRLAAFFEVEPMLFLASQSSGA